MEQLLFHWSNKQTDRIVAIGGPNCLPEKKWWQKMINLSLSHPLGHAWSAQAWKVKKPTKVSHIPTTNGLFLKTSILKSGNFSEKYKSAGEDWNLGLRLKKEGDLILFPSPIVINNYANSYFESLKRLFIFGKVGQNYKSFLFYPKFLFFPLIYFLFYIRFFSKNFLPLARFLFFTFIFF